MYFIWKHNKWLLHYFSGGMGTVCVRPRGLTSLFVFWWIDFPSMSPVIAMIVSWRWGKPRCIGMYWEQLYSVSYCVITISNCTLLYSPVSNVEGELLIQWPGCHSQQIFPLFTVLWSVLLYCTPSHRDGLGESAGHVLLSQLSAWETNEGVAVRNLIGLSSLSNSGKYN